MTIHTVLLTGATGFIGFQILLELLESGYAVNAVIRSTNNHITLIRHPKVREQEDSGRLRFTTIADFSAADAWDEALRDVDFLMHVASPLPLPTLDPEKDIFQPSVSVNNNLLSATLKAPKLKRIVLTSSIVGAMPLPPRGSGPYAADAQVTTPLPPFANVYDAYQASKIHLLNKSRELVALHTPRFDIIGILPGYTFGKNERATNAKEMFSSSNGLLLMLLTGRNFAGTRTTGAAHIRDVATVHVRALEQKIEGNRNYGVTVPMMYNKAIDIAKKHFPEAFEKGTLQPGDQPSEVVEWDAKETENLFDLKFKDFEQMIVEVVSQYLDLPAKE
ncbi:NAD(P)-binding protein [Byssothecium circinans]|uniref:NAD(P)-binding protein n=1 Tax=Byssothecium circinans TaxID=147558 RepID=A0A6A5TNL5_9PLEO|nr:NAD(P)-binding protein [Byssothecium circinans]